MNSQFKCPINDTDRRSKNKEHGAKMSPFERSILELTLSGDLESRYRRLTKEEGTMHCDSSLGGDAPEWCRRTIKPGERIANFYEDYSSWTEEQKKTGIGGEWDMAPNCLDCEVRDIADQFKIDYGWVAGLHDHNDYIGEMVAAISGYVEMETLFKGTDCSPDDGMESIPLALIKLKQIEEALQHHYPNSPQCFEEEGREEGVGDAIYRKLKEREKKVLSALSRDIATRDGHEEAGELLILRAFLSGGSASKDAVKIIDEVLQSLGKESGA